MKNLLLTLACFAGCLVTGSASACSADVESIGVETGGKDMLLSFRLTPKDVRTATISFTVTVRYLKHGVPHADKFNYSEQVRGVENRVVPAIAADEVSEIGSVVVSNVHCAL